MLSIRDYVDERDGVGREGRVTFSTREKRDLGRGGRPRVMEDVNVLVTPHIRKGEGIQKVKVEDW